MSVPTHRRGVSRSDGAGCRYNKCNRTYAGGPPKKSPALERGAEYSRTSGVGSRIARPRAAVTTSPDRFVSGASRVGPSAQHWRRDRSGSRLSVRTALQPPYCRRDRPPSARHGLPVAVLCVLGVLQGYPLRCLAMLNDEVPCRASNVSGDAHAGTTARMVIGLQDKPPQHRCRGLRDHRWPNDKSPAERGRGDGELDGLRVEVPPCVTPQCRWPHDESRRIFRAATILSP